MSTPAPPVTIHQEAPDAPATAMARVVAAGGAGAGAAALLRMTVLLTPRAKSGAGEALSLRDWPNAVAAAFKAGRESQMPTLELDVALASATSREPAGAVTVTAARAARSLPDGRSLSAYWHRKMGVGSSPWTHLRDALDAPGTGAASAPATAAAVNPTGRGDAALTLTLERAKQIARRLLGSAAPTRAITQPLAAHGATRTLTRLASAGEAGLGWGALAPAAATPGPDLGERARPHREAAQRHALAVASHHALYLAAATPAQAVAVAAVAPAPPRQAPADIASGIADADAAIDTGPLDAAREARDSISSLPPAAVNDDPEALRKFRERWDASKVSDATDAARRRLFALQAYPSLGRLFNLVIDVEVAWAELRAKLEARTGHVLPDGDHFLYLALAPGQLPASGDARVWTCAKLRLRGATAEAWPCMRAEFDAAAAGTPLGPAALELVDGVANLGLASGDGPRFDIVTLDAHLSIESDAQDEDTRRQRIAGKASQGGQPLPQDGLDLTDAGALDRHSLRTGGLSLIDRGRADGVQRMLAAASAHRAAASGGAPAAIVLDAADLSLGHRLDVGVRQAAGPIQWRPLMDRVIEFGVERDPSGGRNAWVPERIGGATVDAAISGLYPSDEARRNADGAMAAAPIATSPDGLRFAEEVVGTWDGDPMGVTCRAVELRIPADDLAIGMRLRLRDRAEAPHAVPPPLRIGWRYHVGSRAVFAGGVSLNDAQDAYGVRSGACLTLPQTSGPGRALRRHERIDPPAVVLTEATLAGAAIRAAEGGAAIALAALPALPVDHAGHMVIRRMAFPPPDPSAGEASAARETLRRQDEARRRAPGTLLSRRVVLPPSVALEAATRHDAFRGYASADFVTLPPEGPIGPTRVRPRDGLRGVDYDAAWGGLPVLRQTGTDAFELLHEDPDGPGGSPAGDAMFRLLPPGRRAGRPTPFYPDPCADKLVISVHLPGASDPITLAVPFYREEHGNGLVPRGYPDALPIVIDLVPADAGGPAASIRLVGRADGLARYGQDGSVTPSGEGGPGSEHALVRHVELALAPGAEALVSMWCLPSPAALLHAFDASESLGVLASCGNPTPKSRMMAFEALTGMALGAAGVVEKGGIGGLAAPDETMRGSIATLLHQRMSSAPIPELAAVTELRATFAVNIPVAAPTIAAGGLRLLRVDAPTKGEILGYDPVDGTPGGLQDPSNWSAEAQVPGAVDVLVAGAVAFDARSTDGLDVLARAAAAATGGFDDPLRGRPRDSHARGLWPRRADGEYLTAKGLFGFEVAADGRVTLSRDEVPLLRIRRLGAGPGPRDGAGLADLLAIQRDDVRLAPPHGGADDARGRPVVEWPAGFPDGKARRLEVRAVGHARHAGLFRTRTDAVLEDADLAGPAVACWLDATRRPDRISPRSLLPAFCWAPIDEAVGTVRTMVVRVRLRRPWFTAGEGERLGVVLWPPSLLEIEPILVDGDLLPRLPDDEGKSLMAIAGFADEQLGPGGPFVTRWGADPIRGGAAPTGWLLSRANFPRHAEWPDEGEPGPDAVLVRDVLMPLPRNKEEAVDTHRSAEDFLRVSLLTYEPRFDPEQEYWYADVAVDPLAVPDPFLRIGLVRFQAHAPRALQVSEPVVEWVQVLPQRAVSVQAAEETGSDKQAGATEAAVLPKGSPQPPRVRVTVEVTGPGSAAASPAPGADDDAKRQRPVMAMRIMERRQTPSGLWTEAPLPDAEGRDCALADILPTLASGGLRWRGEFVVDMVRLVQRTGHLSVAVEETEWRRPASYAVEPFEGSASEDVLVRSGPRFAAKVDLAGLTTV